MSKPDVMEPGIKEVSLSGIALCFCVCYAIAFALVRLAIWLFV